MKHIHKLLTAALLGGVCTAHAQLAIPTDGSDGVLNITSNTTIDLSLASNARWDANNSTNAGGGVYDMDKWAVVFKYQSVNIAAGATLRFANHPTHAPVVWLVQGDVTIAGTVDVSGSHGTNSSPENLRPAEPGPGGFRGAVPGLPVRYASGLGPGGGSSPDGYAKHNGVYSNPQIVPLIGGSGSFADRDFGFSGGGGGGAVLIAARQTIVLNGRILADGGGRTGSGGAVKLMADVVSGNGRVQALGQNYPEFPDGRIRVEANALSPNIIFSPETVRVDPIPLQIWPPDDAPTVRITHINGLPVPNDPVAPLLNNADLTIQTNGNTIVLLETRNFPIQGAVQVWRTQKFGGRAFALEPNQLATFISGGFTQAVWRATLSAPPGFMTFQARATAP